MLLSCGSHVEAPFRTQKAEFRPIHMAARLGCSEILQTLVDNGCDMNSKTENAVTALMICALYNR